MIRNGNLEETILNIEGNHWTTRDACTGTIVFGMTGSGKSSGPLYKIANKFLTLGYGGVVFCAKPDECGTWVKYAKEAKREEDLLFLSQLTFNYLDHESKRGGSGGGQIENMVNLYLEIVNMGKDKKSGGGGNDQYWQDAVKQLLRNSMTLLQLARKSINIGNIQRLIVDASSIGQKEEVDDSNFCMQLIESIEVLNAEPPPEFQIAKKFFLDEFSKLDERTKSNTVSSFSVTADSMQRGELSRCFSADSTLHLEDIYKLGRILIVDQDQKTWGKLGQYAAGIIKYCFEMMIERREDISDPNALPVFLWADECQFFAIDYDQKFQTTARSSRTLTVYATQNLGNLYDGYGKEKATSLIGNLGTKFFCQNGEYETNEWASKSIGQEIVLRKNRNYSNSTSSTMKGDDNKSKSFSEGFSEQKDYRVDPSEFSTLQTGGPRGQCKVGFVFWQSGRVLNNGSVFVRSTIEQQCRRVCGAKFVRHCPDVPSIHIRDAEYIGEKTVILGSDWALLSFTLVIGAIPWFGYFSFFHPEYDYFIYAYSKSVFINASTCLMFFYCLWFYLLINVFIAIGKIIFAICTHRPRKRGSKKEEKTFVSFEFVLLWLIGSAIFTFYLQYSMLTEARNSHFYVLGWWFLFTAVSKWFICTKFKEDK